MRKIDSTEINEFCPDKNLVKKKNRERERERMYSKRTDSVSHIPLCIVLLNVLAEILSNARAVANKT